MPEQNTPSLVTRYNDALRQLCEAMKASTPRFADLVLSPEAIEVLRAGTFSIGPLMRREETGDA